MKPSEEWAKEYGGGKSMVETFKQIIAEKIYKQGWLSPLQLCDAVLVITGKAEL